MLKTLYVAVAAGIALWATSAHSEMSHLGPRSRVSASHVVPQAQLPKAVPAQFRGAWGPNLKACSPGKFQLDVVEQGGFEIDGSGVSGYETGTKFVRAISSGPSAFAFRGLTNDETGESPVAETVTLRLVGARLLYKGQSYVRCH